MALAGLGLISAPLPQAAAQLPAAPAPSATQPAAPEVKRRWSQVVEPGQTIRPLSFKDKLIFEAHENFRLTSLMPLLTAAGVEQGLDSSPHFGNNGEAFGERIGAGALRQGSMRLLSDGVMPALLHEDPRYYRQATGSYFGRGIYAVSRSLVDKRDSGATGFNYANITGHLLAMAFTMTYYPHRDTNGGTVFRGWGLSIAGSAGNDLFLEFLPDALRAIHERKAGSAVGEPKRKDRHAPPD